MLVTLLFTDIVGSTGIAAELGDRRWRDLIQRHHAIVRRTLKRHRGRELDTAGDGFFARFDRPAEAIRCACAISDEVRELGIEVRAGLHVGEAEQVEGKVGGFAVNVAARVMAVGKEGEVLVSSTLRDAVGGSGFGFADHGVHRLKGIEGNWRLFEVTSVDGVRRSLPLTDEEAKARRSFVEGTPIGPRRDRIVALTIGAAVVAAAAAAWGTGVVGGERSLEPPAGGTTAAERALRAVIPSAFRSTCEPADATSPGAVAAMECRPDENHSVTYVRFPSAEDLETAFESFAAPADPTHDDCSRDPSARHAYAVNGTPVGQVACYVEPGTGPSTTDSVIVWTDDELLLFARVVRGDAADLTLFEWWRTEAGPWATAARPPKDGRADLLEGTFRSRDGTISFEDGRYEGTLFGGLAVDAQLFHGKPATLLLFHRSPAQTFGNAVCPSYEVYRWRLRGDRLSLRLVTGGCREYASEDVAAASWVWAG